MTETFNDEKWGPLLDLRVLFEAIQLQQMVFQADEEAGGVCPAIPEYREEFPSVVAKMQSAMDQLSELASELLPEIEEIVGQFNFSKANAMAHCPKDDCPDRVKARRELGVGWDEDQDQALLQ